MRKVRIILPTPRENRTINRGIKADPDTYELSAAEFRELRPLRGPRVPVRVQLVTPREERAVSRRPKIATSKVPVTVRLDRAVVDYFKASGRGWQTRINATLAAYVGRRPR